MGFIYSSDIPGKAKLFGVDGAPASIKILNVTGPDTSDPFDDSIIITGVGYDQSVNLQFMPTLLNNIYVYSFGDRMGEVQVNGICFHRTCKDTSNKQFKGISDFIKYYNENKATTKTTKTVQIRILNSGDNAITGIIRTARVDLNSAETMLGRFVLTIAAMTR